MKRFLPSAALVVTTIMLTLLLQPYLQAFASQSAAPQAQNCRTFTETGKQLCGKFLDYWNSHGALAQQGFPISNEFQETSATNGQVYTVQYFERAVFELHPENAAPNDVLLSLLGSFQYKAKYPNGEPGAPPPTAVPAPPQGLDGQVQLRGDGVYATFLKSNSYEKTGIRDCAGVTSMTWAITIVNNSNSPYTAVLDVNSVTQTDNTGQKYNLAPNDSYRCHGINRINQPVTVNPSDRVDGVIGFYADKISSATQYLDLSFNVSGTSVTFRYPLR